MDKEISVGRRLKIALYNWAPLHGSFKEGGGVSVYLENISRELAARGHEVSILSSGFIYDILSRKVSVRRANRRGEAAISYFDVVNSRVLAPSYLMFPSIETALDDSQTSDAVESFLRRQGPFDIFHIQNMEGIPWRVLSLREKFPNTRFILSNHNYNAICQQVNLWKQDRQRCGDYEDGAACYNCNMFQPNYAKILASRVVSAFFGNALLGWKRAFALRTAFAAIRLRHKWRQDFKLPENDYPGGDKLAPAAKFVKRRSRAVALINANCDAVISVSKAVEEILLDAGVSPKKSIVNYIGTQHFTGLVSGRVWDGVSPLRVGFLGYTRPDKGFQFLVEALAAMPQSLHGRLTFVFAGQVTDRQAVERLKRLSHRFATLTVKEGYTQAELGGIIDEIDLGIVPPLWDDALPQVAIEFICHGVPILVSDRGGQKEIAADQNFVFTAGNVDVFWAKIQRIMETPALMERFWQAERPLRTMATHIDELLRIYKPLDRLC